MLGGFAEFDRTGISGASIRLRFLFSSFRTFLLRFLLFTLLGISAGIQWEDSRVCFISDVAGENRVLDGENLSGGECEALLTTYLCGEGEDLLTTYLRGTNLRWDRYLSGGDRDRLLRERFDGGEFDGWDGEFDGEDGEFDGEGFRLLLLDFVTKFLDVLEREWWRFGGGLVVWNLERFLGLMITLFIEVLIMTDSL